MNNLTFLEDMEKTTKRLQNKSKDCVLGKGGMMPFNPTNSGSRKILHSNQLDQIIPILDPEPPLVRALYENQFGKYTSSFKQLEDDHEVLARVEKFEHYPGKQYYLLVRNTKTNEYDVWHRTEYEHSTESYGYLYNNSNLDKMKVGSVIPEQAVVKKSTCYDEWNNRQDGVNLLATYLSTEFNKEDGIIISETASEALAAPLITPISPYINDNDKPLNIYGDTNVYKSFPDIGEKVKNGLICVTRRENKSDSLFSLSYDRLSRIMISDDKYMVSGDDLEIIDIDVYCNNPALLNTIYYSQIKFYYEEKMNFMKNFMNAATTLIPEGAKRSYELQKMMYNFKKILSGGQYINDKPFTNCIIKFTVLDRNKAHVGDKMCNRYGGKGVISKIVPDEEMPLLDNGQRVHVIYNSSTCINRENPGQLFETSLTMYGNRLLENLELTTDYEEAFDMYINYIKHICPSMANYVINRLSNMKEDEIRIFLETLYSGVNGKGIQIVSSPMRDHMSIDVLKALLKEFTFIRQYRVMVPQMDSMKKIRFVEARRRLTCGYQYFYRLKQYGEDKFSAVSLSSTNLRNENARNNLKKSHKIPYAKTPIRFGDMETGDFGHLGFENTIVNLMIHSASPHARRLAEELLTGDPFRINVRLDENSKNRAAEINNVYFLTMGLELEFTKRRKNIKKAMLINPITFVKRKEYPISFVDNRQVYPSNVKEFNNSRSKSPVKFEAVKFAK